VSRIEVLRGSGSSLYGTNAIGGVVDVQTPEPPKGTHGQISVNAGGLGFGRFRGNVSHATENGKFGIGAGVSRTLYTKGIDGDDRAENTNFQTRVDLNPTRKTSISGRIFFSDANVRLNTDPDTKGALPPVTTTIDAQQGVNFTFDANDADRGQKTRFFSGQIRGSHAFNEKVSLSAYYHGLSTRRTNNNGPLGAGFQSPSTSIFDGRIDTVNTQFSWTAVPQNTLTGGYEFEREKFGNEGMTPSGTANFFTRAGQRSNTFFLQNLLGLDEGRLQIAGGFRVQQFSLQRPEFSLTNAPYTNLTLSNPPTAVTFDGAVSYFFRSARTKLRAHIGNGYRVPSLYERFGTFFSTFPSHSFVPIGAPNLKPERSTAFDAGVEQLLAHDRVKLSATYFYTSLFQTIGYGLLPQPDPFGRLNGLSGGGYLNNKGGISRGFETSANVRATSSTDIFTSYTFTNSDQRSPQVGGSGVIQSLGVPDHQFTLVATQRYKRFWVNFDFLATSKYLAPIFSNSFFATRIYRFAGNRRGDLTAGYTFALKKDMALRLYGTVENVFDQEYYESGFRTAGANARIGVNWSF
jgi:iron complex outermembrane receptor protein